jgi:hypothetical protein
MKKQLTDLKFWTSTVSLIGLIFMNVEPSFDFGKWKIVIDAILIYGVQVGILHDYSNKQVEGE